VCAYNVCVYFDAGEYSCLKVNLLFKREFSYYLIQIYIPCCMLVIVSWVSFWLDSNAVPARVSLGVTTLLTMATQTTGINNSLPPVSYTKAITRVFITILRRTGRQSTHFRVVFRPAGREREWLNMISIWEELIDTGRGYIWLRIHYTGY
jgi:hypothetical protein